MVLLRCMSPKVARLRHPDRAENDRADAALQGSLASLGSRRPACKAPLAAANPAPEKTAVKEYRNPERKRKGSVLRTGSR
jgi:hypothetical protein